MKIITSEPTQKNMKYKILWDYGCEGNVFYDGEFDTVDVAIKHAVWIKYSTSFRIVSIAWEPEQITQHP